MMKKVSTLLIVLVVVFVGFLTLKKQGIVANNADENYLNYCAGCHGYQLEKFQDKDWMYGNDDSKVIGSIRDGREDIGMPAFKATFTAREIEQLAKYIKAGIPTSDSGTKKLKPIGGIEKSEVQNYLVDTVITGLQIPWGMAFLPNGDILVSEREGKLYRYVKGEQHEVSGLPDIFVKGQGGLMDLRFHPNYAENGWLYISYSGLAEDEGEEGGCTNIMRARIDGFQLTDQEVIFNGEPDTNRGQHWGCKMVFDNDGHLFFGVGDRGNRDENPQSLENHCGKIHRIYPDGSIPKDNPFVNTPNAIPSIYSYGHRNPQGTTIHPETGQIWETEHGPKGGDELNIIQAGKNYGWPVISYGINYNGTTFTDITAKEGMEQPITYWVPSIAPCGTTFVTGDLYPNWKNNILVGSLRFKYLERVVLEGNKVVHQEKLLEDIGRVRNVEMGPDGYIYVAIENPGKIVRLLPVEP